MKALKGIGWIVLVGVVLVIGLRQGVCADIDANQPGMSQNNAVIEKAVLKVHDELIAAAEKRDAEAMFSYILESEKCVIIQDGQVMSRQDALEQIRQAFERVNTIKYDFKQRRVHLLSPTIAIMTSTGTTTTTIPTGETFTAEFANSSVFVLGEDGWKIIHGHHSIPNDN
jgi:uncharacterized protein (TIGR02246 family)